MKIKIGHWSTGYSLKNTLKQTLEVSSEYLSNIILKKEFQKRF